MQQEGNSICCGVRCVRPDHVILPAVVREIISRTFPHFAGLFYSPILISLTGLYLVRAIIE